MKLPYLKGIAKTVNSFINNQDSNYLNFFDNIQAPVFAINSKGNICYYNASFENCFGLEIKHDTLSKALEVDWRGTTYVKNSIYKSKDEEFFLLNISPKSDHLTTLPDHIPNFTISRDGEIINANRLFYELARIDNFSKSQKLFNYIDNTSLGIIKSCFNSQDQEVTTNSFEIKLNNEDGTTLLAYVVSKSSNTLQCIVINITEYKNLEMHLIHSQKMQAIGQLAGGISHDFNNLLTAMLGFCDLLLIKHPAGDPSFAEIMQIKQNTMRAASLVRQLLAISRKQVLKAEVIDITNVIAELVHLIRRLIGGNINLNVVHGHNLKLIKVDQGQLEQVIINLAVNARDAIQAKGDGGELSIITSNIKITEEGKVGKDLISPAANEKIQPGEYVLIESVDSGIGMDKNLIKKIFEPFFSTKPLGSGTGLGLSTVYGIVKQAGGYLYVASEKGVGTRFYVYLKAVDNHEAVNETVLSVDKENVLMQKDLTGNATILLVEDEIPVRMLGAHALSNKGYKVIEAESGEKGLQVMNERGDEINLIITDVIMPGINGPSFITEVNKKYPNIKVIFVSGYAEESFSETYGIKKDATFNFLQKPFTLKELASKVKSVLEDEETSVI